MSKSGVSLREAIKAIWEEELYHFPRIEKLIDEGHDVEKAFEEVGEEYALHGETNEKVVKGKWLRGEAEAMDGTVRWCLELLRDWRKSRKRGEAPRLERMAKTFEMDPLKLKKTAQAFLREFGFAEACSLRMALLIDRVFDKKTEMTEEDKKRWVENNVWNFVRKNRVRDEVHVNAWKDYLGEDYDYAKKLKDEGNEEHILRNASYLLSFYDMQRETRERRRKKAAF
jgi:hypothetical protein